jgi:hypothetical protein
MTEKKPELPEWARDLVAGEPAGVMAGVIADSRHGIATSASLIPTARQRAEDKPRVGGGEATLQVPGLRWVDAQCDAADQRDRAAAIKQAIETLQIERLIEEPIEK